jgi:hypothetical protein
MHFSIFGLFNAFQPFWSFKVIHVFTNVIFLCCLSLNYESFDIVMWACDGPWV